MRTTPFRKTAVGKFARQAHTKCWRLQKWLYWQVQPRSPSQRRVVLIVGRQRSGTTLLGRVFERDIRSTILHEESCITGHNGQRLRLRPFAEVNPILAGFRTPLIVAKPLVESQRTPEMLREIPDSRAIWMIRHYRDVANSDLKRFRRQLTHIKSVVDGKPGDWRVEGVGEALREEIRPYYDETMPRLDAAALMWYVRNRLFFDQELDQREDVLLCKYEDLVAAPTTTMERAYRFLDIEYPRQDICRIIDTRSLRLGSDVSLAPEIERLCEGLWERLEASYSEA